MQLITGKGIGSKAVSWQCFLVAIYLVFVIIIAAIFIADMCFSVAVGCWFVSINFASSSKRYAVNSKFDKLADKHQNKFFICSNIGDKLAVKSVRLPEMPSEVYFPVQCKFDTFFFKQNPL